MTLAATPNNPWRRFLAALLAASALAFPARAAPAGVNYSDLWWNPAQDGWGVGLQHQGDVIFLTLFIHGADGAGTWYVASDLRAEAGAPGRFRGDLYRTEGSSFAASPEAAATARRVGDVALRFHAPAEGEISYTIDGTTVRAPIERQTWRVPSVAGNYHGGLSALVKQCPDPTMEGPLDIEGPLSITASGDRVTLGVRSARLAGLPSLCTLSGTLSQKGRLGRIEGDYTCRIVIGCDSRCENVSVVNRVGRFLLDRVAVTANGLSASFSATDQDCSYAGTFGGVRLP